MKIIGGLLIALCCCRPALALEVFLKNGDKITGAAAGETPGRLLLKTEEAGTISIDDALIDMPKTYPERYRRVEWKKDLSMGYTQNEGNTKAQLGQISASLDRKTSYNELSLQYDATYSSANGIMNGRKFYAMSRYAYNFGPSLRWYHFYKLEGDQDYFADIDYRLTPSTGVGYWFFNSGDFKLKAETGVGYQYTHYRVPTTSDTGDPILLPRLYADRRLAGNLHLTEDLSVYPSVRDFGHYRVRSQTDLINQFSKRWSLKATFIDDFNSFPPPGFKMNDETFLTSLEYHF